jgi:hypothetical protein
MLMVFFLFILMPIAVVQGDTESAEEYKGIGYCATCHIEAIKEWIESPHLWAFNDPEFQEKYQELGSPESCLSCHTTGFDEENVIRDHTPPTRSGGTAAPATWRRHAPSVMTSTPRSS